MQERVDSGLMEKVITHKAVEQYMLNLHALHNAHLIRAILPRSLVAPIPYVADCQAHHNMIAKGLRGTQDGKRAEKTKKADEKKKAAANAGIQAAAAAATSEPGFRAEDPPIGNKHRRTKNKNGG